MRRDACAGVMGRSPSWRRTFGRSRRSIGAEMFDQADGASWSVDSSCASRTAGRSCARGRARWPARGPCTDAATRALSARLGPTAIERAAYLSAHPIQGRSTPRRLADGAERPCSSHRAGACRRSASLGELAERSPCVVPHAALRCLATTIHATARSRPLPDDADVVVAIESDVRDADIKALATAHCHIARPAFLRYPMRGPSHLSIAANAGGLCVHGDALEDRRRVRRRACKRRAWARERAMVIGQGGGRVRRRPHISPEYLSVRRRGAGRRSSSRISAPRSLRAPAPHLFRLSPAATWERRARWRQARCARPVRGGDDRDAVIFATDRCHWRPSDELPILMWIFNNARYGAVPATLSTFSSGAAGRDNGLGCRPLPEPPFERTRSPRRFAARVDSQPAAGVLGGARRRAAGEAARAGHVVSVLR